MSNVDWDALADEAVTHFKALLRIDTTNPPGNERAAADYIAGVLDREGIAYTIVESAPGRASLVARIAGTGAKGPLLMNGHLDVVPVERERWTHDPFAAVEADGCIWGRGAIDMKNMVTMSLMALVAQKRSGVVPSRDLIFAAVADEEAGSNYGALHLVEKHPDLVRAEYVLNEVGGHTLHFGDARFYPVQVAEKGICWFEIAVEGEPGHGSMPHPGNAVVRLARAIEALGRHRLPQHETQVVREFLTSLAARSGMPKKWVMPLLLEPRLSGLLIDAMRKSDPDGARGIDAMLRNTVSPTMLSAGSKINVIPSRATAKIDGRILPGSTKEELLAEVRRVIGDDVTVNVLDHHQGTTFPVDTPLYDAIRGALRRHDPEGIPVPYMIPGFTDSFAYARLGAVCYGFSPVRLPPGMSFTRMYHGHDERIPVDGFRWGLRVLVELVRDFCST